MKIKAILILTALAVIFSLRAGFVYGTAEDVEFTITKTERVTTGSGDSLSSKYLIFTDGETFKNTDSLWYWKFNSSDLYGSMKPGTTYTAQAYGFRVPFLSWYRNVVHVREVAP